MSDQYHEGSSSRDPAIRGRLLPPRVSARMTCFSGPGERLVPSHSVGFDTFNTAFDLKQEQVRGPYELFCQ